MAAKKQSAKKEAQDKINLAKGKKFDAETARKAGAKGGKAAGEKNRKKKALREIVEAIGAAKAPEEVAAKMKEMGLSTRSKITLDEAIMMAQYGKALSGNVQSANFIAEIKGEKVQKIEQVNIDDKSMTRLNEDFGLDGK